MTRCQEIERSIIKKYKTPIWNRFIGGIKDYDLIQAGDRIAVCISGGKDSMLLAKCLQNLRKYSAFPFDLEFLVMDPGYRPENRKLIESNAELLEIPITVFETDIFDVVYHMEKNPCYLCARMRRGHLYKQARERGCNKIALGHHFDDVVETILMSMIYGGEMKTMMPKLHSRNFDGMELIRPLYLVREADILAWKRYNNLEFLQCACRFTEDVACSRSDSKRAEMKALVRQLREKNPQADVNIFRSCHNVNLDTVIGYQQNGTVHEFLDAYDRDTLS
ncbi:MAG: tRNA 2-thiocytidine biosynthesis protein TtcA [Clostridiales bacterium]|nr:tRNA 2-thiocytidine biosynthesis protein TtcA [Clostridiales bacterium]